LLTAAAMAAAVLAIAAYAAHSSGPPPPCGGTTQTGGGRAASRAGVPRFSHVVVIAFENKAYGDVIGNRDAPTFNRLARQQALLTQYCGVAHPSLPNYLALVSGSTHGITSDCTDCPVAGRSLADSLESAHRTWKTYAEGLPHAGFTGGRAGRYAKKHDPFAYFTNVTRDPRRLARIVPLSRWRGDLAAHALPDFSLVVPDLCHDMHDCSVATGDRWLHGFLPPLLASPELQGGVVFIVFDEAESGDRAGGGGHTIALAAGPTVRPGARATTPLTHYSLLRTVEDAWSLPRLGRSAAAPPIQGIWRASARRASAD
jgi:acid phosphatase